MAANASSSSMFWRVTTTLILKGPKPAAARLSMARAGGGEGALAADGVVGGGGGAVDADLHVEVVEGGQLAGPLGGEPGPVGGELHPDPALDGVGDEIEEVGPQHGLAPADVDVEDLHVHQVVHDAAGLGGRQLVGVAAARRAEAVHAGQVAGVGQLPGQADRRVEAPGELLLQAAAVPCQRASITSESASRARARRYDGALRPRGRAHRWPRPRWGTRCSDDTSSTSVRDLRNTSRRLP